ncbi:MAG TPA: hypothetical protein PK090_00525 [Smithellaceae bacterium]|mgnify:CR=1 FL=1|nr:hypothetical protein [Smithellaceae bacterium]
MKKWSCVLSFAVGMCLMTGFAWAQPAGKALVDQACAKCHNTKRVYSAKKTPDQWEQTLDRMIKKGAAVSPDQRKAVLDFLNTLNK